MKIGIVTTWFERGAAYVSRQYRNLLADEHEVFIYARGGEASGRGDPAWDDTTVTWAFDPEIHIPTYIDKKDFTAWLQRHGIDIVFFNEQHFWLPVLWCRELGIKTGAYIDYYNESTIPLFGSYDFLICNTKRHYSAFDWHDQAYYVPWGTDIDVFRLVSCEPVDPSATVFFHSVGMSPRRKGTDVLLRAFSSVSGAARLLVHTQVPLEKELPDLTDEIRALQNKGRLEVVLATIPAPGLYHRGDVYVYPSRLEGIGLTIAEALACGLPVIVPDQPPMNEFVEADGTCGALVPVARQFARVDGYYWPQCSVEPQALAEAMQEFVNSTERLSERKRRARAYAEYALNWNDRRSEVVRIFSETRILSNSRVSCERALAFEYGRWGGRLDLWLSAPYLVRLGQRTRSLVRSAIRPLKWLTRLIVRRSM